MQFSSLWMATAHSKSNDKCQGKLERSTTMPNDLLVVVSTTQTLKASSPLMFKVCRCFRSWRFTPDRVQNREQLPDLLGPMETMLLLLPTHNPWGLFDSWHPQQPFWAHLHHSFEPDSVQRGNLLLTCNEDGVASGNINQPFHEDCSNNFKWPSCIRHVTMNDKWEISFPD